MSIVVADVVTEYGSFYINHGQNMADLYKKLYQPSVTENYFLTSPSSDTRYRVARADMDRVLQPFQKAFTPIGAITFKPHWIEIGRAHV